MSTTWLQAINSVQRRLREAATASHSTTAYSLMIGEWVNETKREVEDAWNWNVLRQSTLVTTVPGTPNYQLTNVDNRARCLNVYSDTNNYFLSPMSVDDATTNFIGTGASGPPRYYTFNGQAGNNLLINLYPTPSAVQTISFQLVVPQVELIVNNDIILVPAQPVILGAYMRALVERGEDGSTQYQWAAKAYDDALATAISQDEARTPGELVFYVV
jgi:hypothetical protein